MSATTIEALKEQARSHEQKEEWQKALDLYKKAIDKLAADQQPDIGLYNRVADLMVRQGQIATAVENYEKAIELYMESELPNNAIAVCKKIVRNMPQRHAVYLRMGQIRGKQGLLADARQNFLTYAERMQAEGNVEEGLRALTELADLSPEDPEIRLAIAGQMKAHGRTADALAQLQTGYQLASLRGLPTAVFEQMIQQLGGQPGVGVAAAATSRAMDLDLGGLGDIALTPPPGKAEVKGEGIEVGGFEISVGASGAKKEEGKKKEEKAEEALSTFDFSTGDEEEAAPLPILGADEDEGAPLPMLGEEEEEGEPLPMITGFDEPTIPASSFDAADFGESDKEDREGEDLPVLDFGAIELETGSPSESQREAAMEEGRPAGAPSRPMPSPPPQRTAESSPPGALPPRPGAAPGAGAIAKGVSASDPMGHEMLAARGDLAAAMTSLRKLIRQHPEDPALAQKLVDYATRLGDKAQLIDAQLDLADALRRIGQAGRAAAAYKQVLASDPKNARALAGLGRAPKAPAKPAAQEGFVDLGAMLLGDDDGDEKTTRFVVAYEEPSGDEHADFAKMLSQFKAKVAQNLSADDVKAHLDLGTAYKEMGLIDEAISEFQQALRASADHLPTYEMLGQCFMEKGEPEAAVRSLKRALEAPYEVEDELLGIYYYLARAYEQLGNTKDALEFYDRVFTLDINFADVTERLRALR